jgi:transposase
MADAAEGISTVYHGARVLLPVARRGRWATINHAVLMGAREAADREASPAAGVVDRISIKTTEAGGPARLRRGPKSEGPQAPHHHRYQRVAGGRPGSLRRHSGSRRLRPALDGDQPLVCLAAPRHRRQRYAGEKLTTALASRGKWTIGIIQRFDVATGFVLLPRRWVVERTPAWLNQNCRLAKDFKATIAGAEAWFYIASVKLLSRRMVRPRSTMPIPRQTLRKQMDIRNRAKQHLSSKPCRRRTASRSITHFPKRGENSQVRAGIFLYPHPISVLPLIFAEIAGGIRGFWWCHGQ